MSEAETRRGRQTPTASVVLPYTQTSGAEAVELYHSTGRTAQPWQELLLYGILACAVSVLLCKVSAVRTLQRGLFVLPKSQATQLQRRGLPIPARMV